MADDTFRGMDVAAARKAANEMLTDAAQIGSLIRMVDGTVAELPWEGPDAIAFREQWRGRFRTELTQTVDNLVRQGGDLEARAARQEQASRH